MKTFRQITGKNRLGSTSILVHFKSIIHAGEESALLCSPFSKQNPSSPVMAYSPSTNSATGLPNSHVGRRSPTPQPLSKRDKRRQQHMAHQQELLDDFSQNRDHHYRSQLIALQNDMNLIQQADPYQPENLEDSAEEIAKQIEATSAGNPFAADMSSLAGRWFAEFVYEINEAKEEKELALINLARNHQSKLEQLKYECDYRCHLAAEECDHMESTIRERLVQSLSHKRAKLMKEKEQLDIADTNALLLHPSQFSITNPSSPGGGQTSRKTRFRGNRADPEELGNGFAADNTNKRKRKHHDDDLGSPSRNGNSTPAERARSRALAVQTGPLNSIHSLFTEKELAFQSHQAQIAAKHFFSTSQKEGEANGASKRGKEDDGDKSSGSRNNSDAEDEDGPEAADMERTASQNVHVTRSTRNAGGLAGLNILSDLAEKAASRPTLPYATLNGHGGRNGTFLSSPSRLMDEEIEEDLIKIAEMTAGREKHQVDRKMIDNALKPLDRSRSNLAPDWPIYLDVHLVNIDPRRATAN